MASPTRSARMLLLIDENLPSRLARFFKERGHTVHIVRIGEKDPAIIADADERGAILITSDKGFLRRLTRHPKRDSGRYKKAGLIVVVGNYSVVVDRFAQVIELIEFLYSMLQAEEDTCLIMRIEEHTIWIDR